MKNMKDYYEKLHNNGKEYSAGVYDIKQLLNIRCVKEWVANHTDTSVKVLDIGCGKGVFLRDFIETLKSEYSVSCNSAIGIDLVESPGNVFAELEIDSEIILQNLDGEKLNLPDDAFEIITCNHVLEHIFETENLLREIHRVLKPKGLCILSTPNLAAWINRGLLLCGIQPLGTELGIESITYGFRPETAKKRLQSFTPAGHIRSFTPGALKDIFTTVGLNTIGWWNQDRIPIFRITKWAGRGIGIIATKY
jgi:2-polyprenyl-3-methyl-5-hydroxy-6-metoxy-1,4-benzoquinol methylase